MTRRSVGFKIGIVTCALHLCWVVLAFVAAMRSQASTAALAFVPFYVLDAPVQLLLLFLPFSSFELSVISPLVIYGVLGSSLWFAIPWFMDRLVTRVFPAATRRRRWLTVSGMIPLFVIVVCIPLSAIHTVLFIRQERPAELKKLLGSSEAGYLVPRVVFDDGALGSVSTIARVRRTPDGDPETMVGCFLAAVFLGDGYKEKHRVAFPEGFWTLRAVRANDTDSCRFIARVLSKGAVMLSSEGKERWRHFVEQKGASIDGVRCGDIDADGTPEFAVYHRYQDGITLLDENGKVLWTHRVSTIQHLEMADIRGNGKEEIIYSNPNHGYNLSAFNTVGAEGTVVDELIVPTYSGEFAVVRWPDREGASNLLITEENRMRIVDMKGNDVIELEAPGCRCSGKMNATTVRFLKDGPAFLAVRKNLHPSIVALFVYGANGKLVFQKAETTGESIQPSLAAVPVVGTDIERLLVGAPRRFWGGAKVIEYSLAQESPDVSEGSADHR